MKGQVTLGSGQWIWTYEKLLSFLFLFLRILISAVFPYPFLHFPYQSHEFLLFPHVMLDASDECCEFPFFPHLMLSFLQRKNGVLISSYVCSLVFQTIFLGFFTGGVSGTKWLPDCSSSDILSSKISSSSPYFCT